MANLAKISGLVLGLVLLTLGCVIPPKAEKEEIVLAGYAGRKAELLNQIERKYENPEAHYELGKLYFGDGLWEKAEWQYNVALGFDPVHHGSQAGIVRTLIARGKQQRAVMDAEMYMNQAAVSAESSLLLGQAFQNELLDDYALACYQRAMGIAPNSAALQKQAGYYYLSKGDLVRAEGYLRRSFQLDPYQAEVAGQLGRMGISVQIPRKTEKNTKKLDKLIEEG